MNTRFKFFLINYLGQRRVVRDSGFALPMAIMVGASIIIVGLAVVIQAQSNQSKVVSQVTSAQASAVAEAGATQYINFLNNNRGLIAYDSCVDLNTTTGVCSDISTNTEVDSWVTASASNGNLTGISNTGTTPTTVGGTSSCSSSGGGGGTPPASYQSVSATDISNLGKNSTSSGSTSGWKDTPDGKAQYRLVSYKVTRTTASDPTTTTSGTLTVEGRVNQNGTGNSATDGNNTGKARMEFKIPVTAKQVPATGGSGSTGFPGVWAQNFSVTSNTNSNAYVWNSNTCYNSTAGTGTGTALTVANIAQGSGNPLPSNPLSLVSGITDGSTVPGNVQVYQGTLFNTSATDNKLTPANKPQAFPPLPNNNAYPASSTLQLVYGPDTNETGTVTENSPINCSNFSSNITFPRSTSDVSAKNVAYSANSNDSNTYVYRCTGNFNVANNRTVTLGRTGKETIVFYVNGSIHPGNANNIGSIKVGGTAGSIDRTRGIFYVKNTIRVRSNGIIGSLLAPYALQFYVYNAGNATNGLQMIGNGTFSAFVFAPTATVAQNGTTDTSGAIWAKSLDKVGNTKNWQGIFDDTKLMVEMPTGGTVTSYSLDGNPSSYRRVPVQ